MRSFQTMGPRPTTLLWSLLLLLGTLSSVYALLSAVRCPAQYIGAQPYEPDCRRYTFCWNGLGRVERCAAGHTFNVSSLQCERTALNGGGHVDCGGGDANASDLTPATSRSSDATSSADPTASAACSFDCQLDGVCVPSEAVCNGADDCGNALDERDCPPAGYRLELPGGNDGVLLVHALNRSGTVCNTGFGMREATVACRELGFARGAESLGRVGPPSGGHQQQQPQLSMLDQVSCRGDEMRLADCFHSGWMHSGKRCKRHGDPNAVTLRCRPKEPVVQCPMVEDMSMWRCAEQARCVPQTSLCDRRSDCDDGSDERVEMCGLPLAYRLMANGTSAMETSEGAVEVRYKGVWGTVCDNGFGQNEATVVCGSLGFEAGKAIVYSETVHNTLIWLDGIQCDKLPATLDQCVHNPYGDHSCQDNWVAAVKCTGPQTIKTAVVTPEASSPPTTLQIPPRCGSLQVMAENTVDDITSSLDGPMHLAVPPSPPAALHLAQHGHHPWQVSVRVLDRRGRHTHNCGGAIVDVRHILTAGHCLALWAPDNLIVRVGGHSQTRAEPAQRLHAVHSIHKHPQFRNSSLSAHQHDIALMRLSEPIEFDEHVQPVCMPDAAVEPFGVAEARCTIAGWGRCGGRRLDAEMLAAKVRLVEDERCGAEEMHGGNFTEGMLCADWVEKLCGGFSGGPLVCENNGVHSVFGVFSWIEQNKPSVFTKVSEYIDWIKKEMDNIE